MARRKSARRCCSCTPCPAAPCCDRYFHGVVVALLKPEAAAVCTRSQTDRKKGRSRPPRREGRRRRWSSAPCASRTRTRSRCLRPTSSTPTPCGKQFAISHIQDDILADFHAPMDLQAKDLMIPFQCFCRRRGLQFWEIILDGTDASKVTVDFVVSNKVDKLVLGSASRNAFTSSNHVWSS